MNHVYLIPFLLLCGLFYGMTFAVLKLNRWKALPTEEQYLASLAGHLAGQPAQCSHCASATIEERGEWGRNSQERVFVCQGCGRKLYRNQH